MAFGEYHTDNDIVTNSLLKTFGRCPRMALYKHHDLLAPRSVSKPLKRGSWFHALLEAYYSGDNWKKVHKQWVNEYSKLFDEEKEKLGDLPTELYRLMKSYLWHYRNDTDWIVHEVEMTLEAPLPTGQILRGKVDLLIEDELGLWVVDHKTHNRLPSLTTRLLDRQSIIYLWLAHRNGIPVTGFIWNYIKTDGPRDVKITRAGRLAKRQGATDFPTAYRSIQQQGYDVKEFREFLLNLKQQRYISGEVQYSPFFQRHIVEKDKDMIKRSLRGALTTAKRYRDYDFEDRDAVERINDRSCDWCGYRNLCTTELIGGNAEMIKKQEYVKHDPLAYYKEEERES